ncbi:HNH endonuclease [Flavobacterium croceum DSM 17960]|uniref:HNH endonuclease n=1 Tax=Flavobacterium croceum DSM 17960 TaxID=1121886 RepID=A0A2S4N4X2_9FLAO|nr:HNH endonuclease domain-containing protein [Flavobacterium croceum]POS00792.1 HNH endonuclease [Flavobacterium croceum DSM 17960]
MILPTSNNLPINKLASVFGSTTATYKFYWFLALIELVEEGNIEIEKKKIFSRMISNSWYTINYFKLSFGKSDKFQIAVETILNEEELTIDAKKSDINYCLENSEKKEIITQLFHFDTYVPYKFLSPWFNSIKNETENQQKNRIYSDSKTFVNDSLYALHKDFIVINPIWINYLKLNAKVLKDYCYWNLALFLQTRNPNVPDIPSKLIKPAIRNGLAKQTNEYWKLVFKELGSINCIFTNTKLYFDEKNYALDHFVPHAFVSHDLIWNLLPIEKKFNSSKSDKLPLFDKHFDKFYDLQKIAFEINKHHNSQSKYMDEFLTIFPNIEAFEKDKFSNTIQPLITIASNNGFLFMNE